MTMWGIEQHHITQTASRFFKECKQMKNVITAEQKSKMNLQIKYLTDVQSLTKGYS